MSDRTVPFDLLRVAVRGILEMPYAFQWSVQGFGMMRTYFGEDKRHRLNIWDSALAVPNVSLIHDHPWNFRSWVISGRLTNIRYHQVNYDPGLPPFQWMKLVPGDEGGPLTELRQCWLVPQKPEENSPGHSYAQYAREIHATQFVDGTVTVNDRTNRGEDVARVFWMHGDWVDAKPRQATPQEIVDTTRRALATLTADLKEPGK